MKKDQYLEIYNALKDAVHVKTIDKAENARKCISKIEKAEKGLPDKITEKINEFVTQNLKPLAEDRDEFFRNYTAVAPKFARKFKHPGKYWGKYEKGSMEEIIMICQISEDLNYKLERFVDKCIRPELTT